MPSRVAVDLLLAQPLAFLLKRGYGRDSVVAVLREFANHIEASRRLPTPRPENYELMLRVAGVVRDWCWQSSYTAGPNAQPVSLKFSGSGPNLRSLIRKRFPDRGPRTILKWMKAHGIVVKQDDGSFSLTGRFLLIGDSEALVMERVATLAAQYLETGLNNLRLRDTSRRNVDRTARVFHLPEKFVPQFLEMAATQTQSLLESVDIWLEGRDDPNAEEATVEAAVHSYAYIGAPKLKRSRK